MKRKGEPLLYGCTTLTQSVSLGERDVAPNLKDTEESNLKDTEIHSIFLRLLLLLVGGRARLTQSD
jgi:hypothetical protein